VMRWTLRRSFAVASPFRAACDAPDLPWATGFAGAPLVTVG
jgi:hypothetical protein